MANSQPLSVARYECKYHVLADQVPAIARYLESYCVPDSHSRAGAWYPVQSLYLDSDSLRLFRDTANQAPFRFKLRVRAYGDSGGPVKLEVKRKRRELIVKTSASVRAEDWSEAARGGLQSLHETCGPAAAEFLQAAESLHAAPKVLVRYERLAFSSVVDSYVRVTFDRHITCRPDSTWTLCGDPRAWRSIDNSLAFAEPDSACVMEIKYCDTPAQWLRDMVLHFGLERRGYSKYARAIRRTFLEREAAWDLRSVA